MRKKNGVILGIILIILSFFACSDINIPVPANIQVQGTVNVPGKISVTNLGALITDSMQDSLNGDSSNESNMAVYHVDYPRQEIDALCLYIPIDMTEDLNPDHFLQTIARQMNDGFSAEPRPIELGMSNLPPHPPNTLIEFDLIENILDDIPRIHFDDIAHYVVSIDFDQFTKSVDSGIGINFELTDVVDGLMMTLRCVELNITETKILQKGDNKFGNEDNMTLMLRGDERVDFLNFDITLQSADPDNLDTLFLSSDLVQDGQLTIIKGVARFFQHWTEAVIDLQEAVRGRGQGSELAEGEFPSNGYMDLSSMGSIFNGFTFEGMVSQMYMGSSNINTSSGLRPRMKLSARYGNTGEMPVLFDDHFSLNSFPLVLDDYLSGDEGKKYYNSAYLPGMNDGTMSDLTLDAQVLADIFEAMPDNLSFTYSLSLDGYLTIYNTDSADTPGQSASDDTGSKIRTVIMFMLPLQLRATRDGSTISLPESATGSLNDLLGRDEPGSLFDGIDFQRVKMTIDLQKQIFNGGYLFIDRDEQNPPSLLFSPQGIKLDKKKMVVNFDREQITLLRDNLIKPHLWIQFNENEGVTIPKNSQILDIRFEIKTIISTGDR